MFRPAWTRRLVWTSLVLLTAAAITLFLFVIDGIGGDWRRPVVATFDSAESSAHAAGRLSGGHIRVVALNAAKCWFHAGGLTFTDAARVRANLDRIAAAIDEQHADIVFLSEVVMECSPVPIDQVEYLARKCGFAHSASGENYRFGLPFYRVRSGNAVLTSLPLRAVENVQLEGQRPFWNPTNNRRALWCEVELNGTWLLVASIRNDSFDLDNNLLQTDEILKYAGDRPALLGGDFNADSGTLPMQRIGSMGRFTTELDATPTYPSHAPTRRLDHVFGPKSWTLLDSQVFDTHVSDHLGVAFTFALPTDAGRPR